jgi:DNA polymerase family A
MSGTHKILKVDLSQIECRMLNTIARQWDVVQKFRDGVDLYSELASQFYQVPVDKSEPAKRGTGKQLELSCGYGAGGPTIVRTARAGTYGPPVYLTDEQGIQASNLYRGTHGGVVNLWDEGKGMLWHLFRGETVAWNLTPSFALQIKDHRIFHPFDGMWLDFSTLTWDAENREWRHRVRNGWRRTYGPKLIENVVQWLASYPIRKSMVRINREIGLRVPLTVHDDVFTLIPLGHVESAKRAIEIMSEPLPWLPECPISVEWDLLDALDK